MQDPHLSLHPRVQLFSCLPSSDLLKLPQVVPTRTVKTASKARRATANGSAAESADEGGVAAAPDLDDLLPRADISSQVGSKVIAALGSTNWKERNHTMDDIENIVKAAVRVQPTVGDLVPALKVRGGLLPFAWDCSLLTVKAAWRYQYPS